MGIADGVSENQLKSIDLQSYTLFKRWRNKEIDIKELKIPQMEFYMDFWERGLALLNEVAHKGSSLMICSNSLMILLAHIMLGNHPKKTNMYRHIDIENCEMITFNTYDYKVFTLNKEKTTVRDVVNHFV